MDPRTTFIATFETELGRCAVRWSEPASRASCCRTPAGGLGRLRRRHRSLPPSCARDRGDGGRDGRRVAGSPRRPARRAWHRRLPAGRLRGDARDPAGTTRSYGEVARAIGRRDGARDVGRRWPATRSRSSSRATASSRRTAHSPGSRHRAAWRRSAGCSSSRARRATASRSSSANARRSRLASPRKVARRRRTAVAAHAPADSSSALASTMSRLPDRQ